VIGIDANAPAMAVASRRAARSAAHAGLPNALFVVAAAERLPGELLGIADEVTIHFPWGSLLRGAIALDEAAASGIASLLRPGACLTTFVSMTPRDGLGMAALDEPGEADALAARWACHGLLLESVRPAAVDELRATGSSWARRLLAGEGSDRPAWRLTLRRAAADTGCGGTQGAAGVNDPIRSHDVPAIPR
jgi:hypothetical protein